MKKWQILILITLFLIPQVQALVYRNNMDNTTVQISTDNVTWYDVSELDYMGGLNETKLLATATLLHEETRYYVRAMSDDAEWGYYSFTTEGEMVMLSMIVGLALVSCALIFFAFKLGDEHFLLKMLLMFFALYTLILVPSTILNGTEKTVDTFMKLTLWIFRLFVIYVSVYIFWHWIQKSEKLMSIIGRNKEQ